MSIQEIIGIQEDLVPVLRASLLMMQKKEKMMGTNGWNGAGPAVSPAGPVPVATPASLNGDGTTASKLTLEPNVPQLIALKFPTGKIVDSRYGDEKQVFYSLLDGRAAYVSLGISQSINNLMLGNREQFWICKRWNGERGQKPRYDVWLTPEGERARATEEMAAESRKAPASAPAQQTERGTGTNGPVATRARVPVAATATEPDLLPWGQRLLGETTQLLEVYAQACDHAETLGIPHAVVRTLMISAFIGLQKKGRD